MPQLRDVIAYLAAKYPHKSELSTARITKMVYLADWKNAIGVGEQLTQIDWYFDSYGPFVWDVLRTAESSPELFSIEQTKNFRGEPKRLLHLKEDAYSPQLTDAEKSILDHVISSTKDLNWNDFIKLVYSTYPVISSERYSALDLVQKATEYKAK